MRFAHRLIPALCTGLLLLAAAPARAAEAPEPWRRLSSSLFSHLGPAEGLPYPVGMALAQDGDGFIWIGTPGGLARWDGYRMRVFRHRIGDPSSLPENIVPKLLVDERGRLWVGTVSGHVARYEPDTERFVTHRSNGSGIGRLHGLGSDRDGGVWAVGNGGLAHLDGATGRWRRDDPAAVGLPGGEIRSVLQDRGGALWVGTARGLLRRAAGDGRFQPVGRPDGAGPVMATALFEDHAGTVWFGTASGQLGSIGGADGAGTGRNARLRDEIAPSGHRVTAIVEPEPGLLWISEFGGGIRELHTASGAVRQLRQDPGIDSNLADDSVMSLMVDRSGLVWASGLGGVDRHNPLDHGIWTILPNAPDGLTGKHVRSMGLAPDGTVWLGFRAAGLARLDPQAGRVVGLLSDGRPNGGPLGQMLQAVAALANGEVWVGTGSGLHRIEPKTGDHWSHGPLHGASILTLMAEEPVLWAGGSRGLARIDLAGGTTAIHAHDPERADSLSDNSVQALLRDRRGRLWVGTQRGLNLFDAERGTFRRFLHDPDDPGSLPNDTIHTLLEDREGRLWIGTANGIGILSPTDEGGGRFRQLGSANGLPHDTITVLLEDSEGLIWAGGGDRLANIDPLTDAVRTFGPMDGAGIRTQWTGSGARLSDGTLLFGGFGGLTVVQPGRQKGWRFPPPVVATEIRVGGRPVLPPKGGAPIVVAPEDRGVQVEFAALDFSAPERNRYTYRLEGYDEGWITADSRDRKATYTNLPPGSYRLVVHGTNRDGLWSDRALTLGIEVLPAWYQMIWFQAAAAAAALAAVFAAVHARTAWLKRRQRYLERQVAERTAEVERAHAKAIAEEASARRAMEEAEAADRAKSRFLAVVSHEIRTPLNGVLGMLQLLDPSRIEGEQRRYLEIARESGNTLISLIESIIEHGRLEAEGAAGGASVEASTVDPRELAGGAMDLFRIPASAHGVQIGLFVAPRVPAAIRCDRVRITRVLHNLLGNAIKFTPQGRIAVSVDVAPGSGGQRPTLRLSVADTGIGIAHELHEAIFQDFVQADDSIARRFGGTGLGLAVCRRIATLLGGSLSVESTVGVGSAFHLEVPVDVVEPEPARADSAPPAGGAALSVLLVDDDRINRQVGAGLLGALGHRVTLARDGAEALDIAATGRFDVVLADVHMPGIDGIETIRRLRELPATREAGTLFVTMSADVTENTRQRCVEAGADATLSKPVHLNALRAALARRAVPPPRPAGNAGAALLDHAFLRDQHDALGMAEMMRLGRLFGRVSRQMIADIDRAAARGDEAAARALAHRLRSAAGALGLTGLAAAAAAVEAGAGSAEGAARIEALTPLRRASLDALRDAARGQAERASADQGAESVAMPIL